MNECESKRKERRSERNRAMSEASQLKQLDVNNHIPRAESSAQLQILRARHGLVAGRSTGNPAHWETDIRVDPALFWKHSGMRFTDQSERPHSSPETWLQPQGQKPMSVDQGLP